METGSSDSRRACEPCRRKKVKCPGERPTCAFCRRLNQSCTYAKRASRLGITKDGNVSLPSVSQDRVHVLESHIEQIYALLNDNNSADIGRTPTDMINGASPVPNHSKNTPELLESAYHLHHQTINEAIELFNAQLQCGPSPWNLPTSFVDIIHSAPPPLCLAFVALTSRLSTELLSDQARGLCASRARREILTGLAADQLGLESVQTLCLLIQDSIAESRTHAAWTDIGIGIRTAITRYDDRLVENTDDWLRAFWCLWALDRMFCSGFSMITSFPLQKPHPPHLPGITFAAYMREDARLSSEMSSGSVIRIDTFCLQLLDVWANAMAFAQTIKDQTCDKIWSANGSYQQVMSEVYDLEIQSGEVYRLRNAKPAERSTSQFKSEKHFWAPWFMTQILYHAIQALINHPLLHIVRIRGDQAKRPPSFLQHTVDQTLLHSSWIAKLISLCNDKELELTDPFIAHLASVAATALMFFLDSSDAALSAQATFGFNTCYQFVEKLSKLWAHLRNTVQKLDVLQASRSQRPSADGQSYPCSVQATLLWSLLDYSSSTAPTSLQESSFGIVELNAGTQFLSPLNVMHNTLVDRSTSTANHEEAVVQTEPAPNIGPAATTSSFDEFDIFNIDMFADFQATGFNANFWSDFSL